MNLSPHFTLEEMLHSDTAEKKKIENRINAVEVNNLVRLCTKVVHQGLGASARTFWRTD